MDQNLVAVLGEAVVGEKASVMVGQGSGGSLAKSHRGAESVRRDIKPTVCGGIVVRRWIGAGWWWWWLMSRLLESDGWLTRSCFLEDGNVGACNYGVVAAGRRRRRRWW